MTYQDWLNDRQGELNRLPIFFAYTTEQMNRALADRHTNYDDVVHIGNQTYCLKKDLQTVMKFVNRHKQLDDLMKDYQFAKDAIYLELGNHEYEINNQGNWDVLNCFAHEELPFYDDDYEDSKALKLYFEKLNWVPTTKQAFYDARAQYLRERYA